MPDTSKIAAARLLLDLLTLDNERVPLWVVELARAKPRPQRPGRPDAGKIAAAQLLRELHLRDGQPEPSWLRGLAAGAGS